MFYVCFLYDLICIITQKEEVERRIWKMEFSWKAAIKWKVWKKKTSQEIFVSRREFQFFVG